MPKNKQRRTTTNGSNAGPGGSGTLRHRRGGATSRIREECERFFCETMWAVFRDERNTAPRGSRLTDVYNHDHKYDFKNDYKNESKNDYKNESKNDYKNKQESGQQIGNGQLCTPPDEYPFPDQFLAKTPGRPGPSNRVTAWLELWDYVGNSGFRGFLSEDEGGQQSAFVFFDPGVIGRDLKHALVAIMELADGALDCAHLVVAIDRSISERDTKSLMKGLQWAGFSLASLDHWAGGALDVTSQRWLFMAYEV